MMYEFALLLVATVVYCLVLHKQNAWGWIALYWAVLVVRNVKEIVGGV